MLKQARLWNRDPEFIEYLQSENTWCNTLVDRIVSGRPESHPLLGKDALLTVAEQVLERFANPFLNHY